MSKQYCEDCHKPFTTNREEVADICNKCFSELQNRVKLMANREYRMEVLRGTRVLVQATRSNEIALRGFFACVMPEYPQHKVESFLRNTGKLRT